MTQKSDGMTYAPQGKPRPVVGSELILEADLVLVAYGFDPVPFPPGSDFAAIDVNDWGGMVVDDNQMTTIPGVFSGGDAVRGAQLVVHAVRDGRQAAEGIVRWLATKPEPKREPAPVAAVQPE